MAQAVQNLSVSIKVFLKHQAIGIQFVVHCRICPGITFWSADNPVEVLNEQLLLLVGHFVPTKVIRVRNKDKPWFDDQCRNAFGLKQESHLGWTRDRSHAN